MKKVLMMFLAVTVAFTVSAQKKNLNKATMAFEKGELSEAMVLIEPTITSEKTKDVARTWYVRGQIYGAIASSEDETIFALDDNAITKAIDSYNMVLAMTKDGNNYNGLASFNKDQLVGGVLNKGVAAFNNDDYEGALKAFDDYTKVAPDDTTGFIYGALMAQQLKKYDEVVKYYEGCFALDYYTKESLNQVIYYELNKLEDPDRALEFVELAQEKYPDDNDFKKTEIDILIKMDKLDEAITELKVAIENEPENASLYSNLGLLYDSQEQPEAAIEQYKKALDYNAADRFSLINLSVFYIGEGDKVMKVVNDMSISDYRKNIDKAEKEAFAAYNQAVPYLKKVLEASPDDKLALQNLQAAYAKLKDSDNASKILEKRQELGYAEKD